MPEMKIRLTDTTSISDINNFFQKLDDTQKVRARKINENEIELYVRGSSKWHLLTDNLKPGFLVTRDYQAAKEKIEGIFKKNGIIKSMRSPQENLHNIMSNHQHDFCAREIKTDLQNAKKVITQKEISKDNIEAFKRDQMCFYTPENLSDIVDYLAEGFDTAPYSTLQFMKFIQPNIPTKKQSDPNSLKFTEIDFEQIENFAIEWQKSIAKENSSAKTPDGISAEKTESKEELTFAEKSTAENFINKITAEICKNIPFARVDLSSETINNSNADLVIFDASSRPDNYTRLGNQAPHLSPEVIDNDADNYAPFTVTSLPNTKKRREKSSTDGFEVTYTEFDDSKFDQEKFNSLYRNLGEKIEHEIKSLKRNERFTIHLPILNPLKKYKLTPEEEAMNLSAFVEHTSEWLSKHPNLRIQIQLSGNAKMEAVEEAYQLYRQKTHTNQPTH